MKLKFFKVNFIPLALISIFCSLSLIASDQQDNELESVIEGLETPTAGFAMASQLALSGLNGWNTFELDSTDGLDLYNTMRKKLGMPRASTLDKIDKDWLYEFAKTKSKAQVLHSQDVCGPRLQEQQIALEAARLVHFNRPLAALSFTSHARKGAASIMHDPVQNYIVFAQQPDLDITSFTVYHELNHLIHNDTLKEALLEDNREYLDFLTQECTFIASLHRAQQYLEQGVRLLPALQSTAIGKQLAKLFMQAQQKADNHALFWNMASDDEDYQKMLYLRQQEKMADLFACDQLMKLKKLSPILGFLQVWTFSHYYAKPFVIAERYNIHPSHTERALYIIGLLADHLPNLAQVIQIWKNTGECSPIDPFRT